jgi:hypothetical protein
MPRPPRAGVLASKRLNFHATPKEHAEFSALARHEGMTLSDLVRLLLKQRREQLEARGVKVPKR